MTHACAMAHLIVFEGLNGTPTEPLIIGMRTWEYVQLFHGVLDFAALPL